MLVCGEMDKQLASGKVRSSSVPRPSQRPQASAPEYSRKGSGLDAAIRQLETFKTPTAVLYAAITSASSETFKNTVYTHDLTFTTFNDRDISFFDDHEFSITINASSAVDSLYFGVFIATASAILGPHIRGHISNS